MSVLELEQEILNLDLDDQIYLADSLNNHLSGNDEKEIEEEWFDLVEQRDKEYIEGKVKTIPSKVVIKSMWENH